MGLVTRAVRDYVGPLVIVVHSSGGLIMEVHCRKTKLENTYVTLVN